MSARSSNAALSWLTGSSHPPPHDLVEKLQSERDAAIRRAELAEADCVGLQSALSAMRAQLEETQRLLSEAESCLRSKDELLDAANKQNRPDKKPTKRLQLRRFTAPDKKTRLRRTHGSNDSGSFRSHNGNLDVGIAANLAMVESGTKSQHAVIAGLLGLLPTFSNLHTYERHQLAKAFRVESFKQGDFIVRQNEMGDRFYILISGLAEVIIQSRDGGANGGNGGSQSSDGDEGGVIADGLRARTLAPGDHFGESALMRGALRTASIVVTSIEAECTSICRADFQGLLGQFELLATSNMKAYEDYASGNKEKVENIRARIAASRSKDEYLRALRAHSAHVIPLAAVTPQTVGGKRSSSGLSGARCAHPQVALDFMREPLVSVDGEIFKLAVGGEAEYKRFLSVLTAKMKRLVAHAAPATSEAEVTSLVADVLLKSARTVTGGDAYFQCTFLYGNSQLVVFTPADTTDNGDSVESRAALANRRFSSELSVATIVEDNRDQRGAAEKALHRVKTSEPPPPPPKPRSMQPSQADATGTCAFSLRSDIEFNLNVTSNQLVVRSYNPFRLVHFSAETATVNGVQDDEVWGLTQTTLVEKIWITRPQRSSASSESAEEQDESASRDTRTLTNEIDDLESAKSRPRHLSVPVRLSAPQLRRTLQPVCVRELQIQHHILAKESRPIVEITARGVRTERALTEEALINAPPGKLSVDLQEVMDEFYGVIVIVKAVYANSPLNGSIQPGDELVEINGAVVNCLRDASVLFHSTAETERTIKVRRRM